MFADKESINSFINKLNTQPVFYDKEKKIYTYMIRKEDSGIQKMILNFNQI